MRDPAWSNVSLRYPLRTKQERSAARNREGSQRGAQGDTEEDRGQTDDGDNDKRVDRLADSRKRGPERREHDDQPNDQ